MARKRPDRRFAALLAFSAPGFCLAAPEPNYFSYSLEELAKINIAVASVFQETPESSAATISTIDKQSWRELGARNWVDAIETQPGIYTMGTLNGGRTHVVRGYGSGLAATRGHGVMIDGISLNNASNLNVAYGFNKVQLGVLDQIDMVRGPGSALYGSNAFHDVVNLRSYRGTKNEITASAEAASDSYGSAHVTASQALTDRLRLNVAFAGNGYDRATSYRYTDPSDGLVKSGSGDHTFDNLSAIAKLDYNQGPLSVGLNYYHFASDTEEPAQVGRVLLSSQARDRDLSGNDVQTNIISLTSDYQLSAANSIEAQLSYRENDSYRLFNLERATITPFNNQLVRTLAEDQITSGLARFKHEKGDFRAAIGFEIEVEEITKQRTQTTLLSLPGDPTVESIETSEGKDRTIPSLVGELAKRNIIENFDLQLGLRFDDYPDAGSHTSPRLGLIYHQNDQHTFKYIFGHAFRAPSFSERFGNGSLVAANPDLKPETIDTQELVWMYHSSRLNSAATFFRSRWRDQIDLDTATNPNIFVNRGNNKAHGVELSLDWQAQRNLLVTGNATWTESENTTFNYEYTSFPEWIINLSLAYDIPERDMRLKLINHINLDVQDNTQSNFANSHDLDNYYRTDLHLGWSVTKDVLLWSHITNLFDRDNRIATTNSSEFGIEDKPFSIGVGAELKF